MRWLAILAMAVALGGCNLVYAERPLFAAGPAPQAEAGLWLLEASDCVFDTGAPVDAWPACAEHQLVADKGAAAYRLFRGGELRLVAGDPLIAETRQRGDHGRSVYFYAGGLATAYGADGRATAFQFWPVQCGPPPPAPAEGDKAPRYVTAHPLPGLKISGHDCLARDADTVRRAARASEAWGAPSRILWIRDR